MVYITKVEYDAVFTTNTITTDDFAILEEVASNIVNRMTVNKVEYFGLSNFTQTLQNKIKRATIYQVNVMDENGTLETLVGNSDLNSNSISVGRYSETFGGEGNFSGSRIQQIDGIPISPMINIILFGTNLLNKADRVYSLERINEVNP